MRYIKEKNIKLLIKLKKTKIVKKSIKKKLKIANKTIKFTLKYKPIRT